MPQTYTVSEPAELLLFLFASLPEVKRTKLRDWLKQGVVQVNDQPVTHSRHPLQAGDVVTLRSAGQGGPRHLLPPGLRIVFEDAVLIVIDKPENLLSMASETEKERTAYACLTDYVRRGRPRAPERVWIVHRLDRETSGLMVFAKTEAAKHALQAGWGAAEKRYLAVVEGEPPAEAGELRSHLDESSPYKVRSAPPSPRTRLAVSHYRVLKRGKDRALLELTLETGRRNQIRVQLADLGCPIAGDDKYDARTDPARRLALHASALHLPHPDSGELLKFESPLPPDLARLV